MSDSPEVIEIVDSDSDREETFHTPIKSAASKLAAPSNNHIDNNLIESKVDVKTNGHDVADNHTSNNVDNNHDEPTDIDEESSPVVTNGTEHHSGGDNPEDSAEAEEFIVEMLTDKDIDKRGNVKYNVKWENYGKGDNTWEPVQNLVGCDWTLQNYQLTRANWLAGKYRHLPSISPANEIDPQPSTSSGASTSSASNHYHPRKAKNNLQSTNNSSTTNHPKVIMNGVSSRDMKEWKVEDIIGITEIENERYFLLRLENCDKKPFIRASLANRLFPDRVIGFYLKHVKLRTKNLMKSP